MTNMIRIADILLPVTATDYIAGVTKEFAHTVSTHPLRNSLAVVYGLAGVALLSNIGTRTTLLKYFRVPSGVKPYDLFVYLNKIRLLERQNLVLAKDGVNTSWNVDRNLAAVVAVFTEKPDDDGIPF